jgi:hypothetical protein
MSVNLTRGVLLGGLHVGMNRMLKADDLLTGAAAKGESDGCWWADHCESSNPKSFINSHLPSKVLD